MLGYTSTRDGFHAPPSSASATLWDLTSHHSRVTNHAFSARLTGTRERLESRASRRKQTIEHTSNRYSFHSNETAQREQACRPTAKLPHSAWRSLGGAAEAFEGGEEFGEGDADAFGVADGGFAFGAEGGHGESHGDPVVAVGIDDCAA